MRRKRSSKRFGSSAWIASQLRVEALGPGVERERVVAAQVLDVEHLEAAALHRRRSPRARLGIQPPGKHVLADEELGVAHADVADEVDHAQAAGLERVGVRADHLAAAGRGRRARACRSTAACRTGPGISRKSHSTTSSGRARPRRAISARELGDLLGRRVDAGAERAVVLQRVEQEAAAAAADVDEGLARREPHLAAHVVHLVALRLLERRRAFRPVRAGVHHRRDVEPQPVELCAEPVVEARIGARLRDRAVGKAPLVPRLRSATSGSGLAVEPGVHAGAESPARGRPRRRGRRRRYASSSPTWPSRSTRRLRGARVRNGA